MGHRLAGGHRVATEVEPVIAAIKARAAELGRPIDEDHYGAGFAFRFGSADEPIVARYGEFLTQRLGKPADGFLAVGGCEEIMALLQRFREAGVHKFILRPIAHGTEDMLSQPGCWSNERCPRWRA